jgi:PAS domain S-box-containing protein
LESGESIEDVEEFRDHLGELRHVQILKTPVKDSQQRIVGTQVIFWDVTERRHAIEALARNESIKTAMFEAALDCIITIDEKDEILEFNPAASKTFGYDRQEVVGREMAELLMPESARERHRANLAQYLGSGEAGSMMIGRLAIPMQRKDGRLFTAELSMQPIPLDESTGFTVFLRDITERQRVAQELAQQRKLIEQTNIELQQEVQERTRAEQETILRNRDLRTLLYVISHDLREPLRAVRNFANLIRDRYSGNLDDKGRDFLGRIIRAAERLDRQLEDVLTLSRAQRLIAPNEQVPLRQVVADVLHQLELRIQETHAKIHVDQDLPTVLADRSWTVQAVLNLVSNALKFTSPGAVPDISIRRFDANGSESNLEGIIVADRGPGIPSEHAERVFDLFQRAVGREIEGTGAGLSIVRRIAERHGGQVWYKPREGGGAEFWLGFGTPPEQ